MPGALDTETLRAMGLVAGAAVPVAPAYAVEVPARRRRRRVAARRGGRLAADRSMTSGRAYRRERRARAPAVAAPAEDEDRAIGRRAPLESLITVRRRDDSRHDDHG